MSETTEEFDRAAEIYDEWTSGMTDTPATVAFLADRAGGGPALELGVGTGRVAVPLAERGVPVVGVDSSSRMLEKLRGRAGRTVTGVLGDMADVPVSGMFQLAYCVFNTFPCLASQEEQIRCVRNVARRLAPGGAFVVEMLIPDMRRTDAAGQRLATSSVEKERVFLEAALLDPVTQRVRTQVVVLSESGIQLFPLQIRYVWPSEMDLMARLAGLSLQERLGGWMREPFTARSERHVSVYRKEP